MTDDQSAAAASFDLIALGEVMLRLDPGDSRIRTARHFTAWEGGGEYNVARALRKCFGRPTAIITALVDNEIGRLIEDLIWQGGVDTRFIVWRPYDGVGRTMRNGLNFTERGFGLRGALGVPDRGHTAAAALSASAFDVESMLATARPRWLHTGGVFAGLSDATAELTLTALRAARAHGVRTSYDLNYRPSLWRGVGGAARAQEVNRSIVPYVDVLIGNEEDFTVALGFPVPGMDDNYGHYDPAAYAVMMAEVSASYPTVQVIAATQRTVETANVNGWGAIAWSAATGIVEATYRPRLEILDRIGGGDGFASGLIDGLLRGEDLRRAVELGAAHGALAMTTPGDTSMATLAEVVALADGGSARVRR